jgi:D-alanine-D-alanine ligase
VLEVNANPCLSSDAGFAAALDQDGIDYVDEIGWLIADARRRESREAIPA